MKIRHIVFACLLGMTVWAKEAVICADGASLWLSGEGTVAALTAELTEAGFTVRTEASPKAWAEALQHPDTAWIVYGNSENVPDVAAPHIRPFLERGGLFITGGGMPLWYIVDERNQALRLGEMVQKDLANFWGGFIRDAGELPLTTLGARLTGREHSYSGSRGICDAVGGSSLIELVAGNGCSPAAIVTFPGNGKFVYLGTSPLHETVFAPRQGPGFWTELARFAAIELPEVGVTLPRTVWRAGEDEAIEAHVVVRNPGTHDITLQLEVILNKDAEFGAAAAPQLLETPELTLKPGEVRDIALRIPAPPPELWGVYQIEATTTLGQQVSNVFHWLPPAAIAYIDIDPVYGAGERTATIGVERLSRRIPEMRLELWLDGVKLATRPVTGLETATQITWTEPVSLTQTKSVLEARLVNAAGQIIHDSRIGVENLPYNPALDDPEAMFRAFNGSQFVTEGEAFTAAMLDMRREMPLFRGVQPFALPPGLRAWLREQDFLCNYGQLLTNYVKLADWRLDDFDASGRSAQDYMPHHSEDVTSWLVRQHSRKWFETILNGDPDIVNLVEAVAGYEPPGVLSDRTGQHGHFLGYAPEAVENYRRALLREDAGVRMLGADGKSIRRYHFAEIYRIVYGEELPEPGVLGLVSWEEYLPLRVTLALEGGYFSTAGAITAYRLHYLLRSYYHMMRLDDLSAQLHAEAPEVHLVIGHDGPLLAQLSSMLYRLPYVDRQTRWLFRSARRQAEAVTFGSERYWVELGRIFGKRVGLHEEIGAGQWASYRSIETSFVSLFTKRAAIPYPDLQVDFYLEQEKKYRLAEELAMYRGFQLAAETGAKAMNNEAKIVTVSNNNSYYPENYRGNTRNAVNLDAILRRLGLSYHGLQTPLVDASLLEPYDVVIWEAERAMEGDVDRIRGWLEAADGSGRTLWINHATLFQLDYRNGWESDRMGWLNADALAWLGVRGEPQLHLVSELRMGERCLKLPSAIAMPVVTPPAGAEVLVAAGDDTPVVWALTLEHGSRVIHSGLPLNNVAAEPELERILTEVIGVLFAEAGQQELFQIAPEEWFACGYRLKNGDLMAAFISPAEVAIADNGPYGDTGDGVEKAAVDIPVTEVELIWHGAGVPFSSYQVRDAWSGELLNLQINLDHMGTLRLQLPVHIAKLYRLELMTESTGREKL